MSKLHFVCEWLTQDEINIYVCLKLIPGMDLYGSPIMWQT